MKTNRSLVFALSILIMQCASIANYSTNRAKDAAEILTVSGERRVYGGNIQMSFISLGIQDSTDGIGYGMRAGSFGTYSTHIWGGEHMMGDRSFLLFNATGHNPSGGPQGIYKDKGYYQRNVLLYSYDLEGYNGIFQFEGALGAYFGIRLGLNLAETLDFLIGFSTLDILDDDLNRICE